MATTADCCHGTQFTASHQCVGSIRRRTSTPENDCRPARLITQSNLPLSSLTTLANEAYLGLEFRYELYQPQGASPRFALLFARQTAG